MNLSHRLKQGDKRVRNGAVERGKANLTV